MCDGLCSTMADAWEVFQSLSRAGSTGVEKHLEKNHSGRLDTRLSE